VGYSGSKVISYRLECTSCLPYPIRMRDATPKVSLDLRAGDGTFGFAVNHRPSQKTFGCFSGPSIDSEDLRVPPETFGCLWVSSGLLGFSAS